MNLDAQIVPVLAEKVKVAVNEDVVVNEEIVLENADLEETVTVDTLVTAEAESHIDEKSDDGKVDSTVKCTQLNVHDLASNASKVEIKHEDKLSSESDEMPLLVTIHATGVIEN